MNEGVRRPKPPPGGAALAKAWDEASAHLPKDWVIHYLHGESTFGSDEPFWIAAATGAALGADQYAEGFGATPDAALRELAKTLASRDIQRH